MKETIETEGACEIEVDGVEYYIKCLIFGTCHYAPAVIGGPPENCSPEESEGDLERVSLTFAKRLSDDVEIKDPQLLTKIEKALDENWLIEQLWKEYDELRQAKVEGE